MIDLTREVLVRLNDATKIFPTRSNGKRIHRTTLYRYVTRGCNGVQLETVQVGGSLCTTAEAVMRFIIARTLARRERDTRHPPAADPVTARRQQAASRELHRELGRAEVT